MHKVHGFACVLATLDSPLVPALARPEAGHAPALKATLKRACWAGRTLRAEADNLISYNFLVFRLYSSEGTFRKRPLQ